MKQRLVLAALVLAALLVGAAGALLFLKAGAKSPGEVRRGHLVVTSPGAPLPANFVPLPPGTRIRVQHIELYYAGMPNAPPAITRSKEETLKLAEQLRTRALSGEDF